MKKNIVFIIMIAIALICTAILSFNGIVIYALFTFVLTLVLLALFAMHIMDNRNEDSIYESTLKNIMKTYDAVLIESDNLPSIEDKNIIKVSDIESLIDAQVEIRKPVYYKKEFDSCTFVLLDEKEACIYSLKRNENVVVPIDNEIEELKINKRKIGKDEFLSAIENTTIISLDNNKKYKISPIREDMENTVIKDKDFIKMLKAEYMPKLKDQ